MTASRPYAAVPAPGAHGDDSARAAAALGLDPSTILDLATTLNPLAPDVADMAQMHLDGLRRYPDVRAATAVLADALGCDVDRLVLTNGGAEAIALVARIAPTGWVDEPEFSLYARHLGTLDPSAGRWRSNPHNPTGRLAPGADRAAVWDEAFWPLTTGTWTRGDADEGAVVVGSLTKLFACPGLRAGYVIAPDLVSADAIRAVQPRWSVNALVASMLPDVLDRFDLAGMARRVGDLHGELRHELRRRQLDVDVADAPWVLVHRAGLRDELAPQGVFVRDCASFGLPGTVRIATPAPDDLPRLLDAIDRVLEGDIP